MNSITEHLQATEDKIIAKCKKIKLLKRCALKLFYEACSWAGSDIIYFEDGLCVGCSLGDSSMAEYVLSDDDNRIIDLCEECFNYLYDAGNEYIVTQYRRYILMKEYIGMDVAIVIMRHGSYRTNIKWYIS